MKICDIMSGNVISIAQDEPVIAAARLMKRNNIGSLPVKDEHGHIRGIITDRDIVLRCVSAQVDPQEVPICEVMSRSIVSATPFESVGTAADKMAENQIRRLPVMDNGHLVGMVALGDIARRSNCDMEAAEALCEISSNFHKK